MQTDELTRVVEQALRGGPLAQYLEEVSVTAARDQDDDDFLLVNVRFAAIEKRSSKELVDVIEAIEDAIAPVDDRYPSVRFLDAA